MEIWCLISIINFRTFSLNKKNQCFTFFSDPFTLCLDIIDKEAGFQATDKSSKMLKYRCSGEYFLIIIIS